MAKNKSRDEEIEDTHYCYEVSFKKPCPTKGDTSDSIGKKTTMEEDVIKYFSRETKQELPSPVGEVIQFQRVIYYEIYYDECAGKILVEKLDFDFSSCGICDPTGEFDDEKRAYYASIIFEALSNNFDFKISEYKENGFSDWGLFFKQDLTKKKKAFEFFQNLPPNFPSPFDTDFTSSAAIIARSRIQNLHFRPKGVTFKNPRDAYYYRELKVNLGGKNPLEQVTFINAYHDGTPPVNRDPNKSVFYTPFNQEHKIDFEMIISQQFKDEPKWYHTPITIDPPLNNGGGGPGGGN